MLHNSYAGRHSFSRYISVRKKSDHSLLRAVVLNRGAVAHKGAVR